MGTSAVSTDVVWVLLLHHGYCCYVSTDVGVLLLHHGYCCYVSTDVVGVLLLYHGH